MHHKRKGPKSTRAGCLLCKLHKRQGAPLKSCQRHSALKAEEAYTGNGKGGGGSLTSSMSGARAD